MYGSTGIATPAGIDDLKIAGLLATRKRHTVHLRVALDGNFQTLRQRINDRHPYAV